MHAFAVDHRHAHGSPGSLAAANATANCSPAHLGLQSSILSALHDAARRSAAPPQDRPLARSTMGSMPPPATVDRVQWCRGGGHDSLARRRRRCRVAGQATLIADAFVGPAQAHTACASASASVPASELGPGRVLTLDMPILFMLTVDFLGLRLSISVDCAAYEVDAR